MLNLIMQAGPGAQPNPIISILPLVMIFIIFYLLLIRPQQKRVNAHKALLQTIARGDTVVTNGGLIGKVTKATDEELTVEVAEGVRIRVMRGMVADIRGRTEVTKDTAKTAKSSKASKK